MGSLETSFQINETEMHYHQAALWLNQKLSAEPIRLLKATGQCQWGGRTNWAFREPVPGGPRKPVLSLVRKVIFHSQVLGEGQISPCHLHRRKNGQWHLYFKSQLRNWHQREVTNVSIKSQA